MINGLNNSPDIDIEIKNYEISILKIQKIINDMESEFMLGENWDGSNFDLIGKIDDKILTQYFKFQQVLFLKKLLVFDYLNNKKGLKKILI